MLKSRVIASAILGILVVLAIFTLPNYLLAFIFAVIALLGAWEWSNLVGFSGIGWKIMYVFFISILLVITWIFAEPYHVRIILFLAALWWAGVVMMLAVYETHWLQTKWLRRVLACSGFIVLIPAWLALTDLHRKDAGVVMFLFALVWAVDITAYFTGKRFGKRKLAPQLSPGKSRGGLWGALVASLILAVAGIYLFELNKTMWIYFGCLCLLTALISVVGDLYESLLKRKAGVKDSGRALPGHGGILDRIDSLTAAAPGFALGYIG